MILDGLSMKNDKIRLTILASGRGSHAENIWTQVESQFFDSLEVTSVISDRAEALVLEKAKNANIKNHCVQKQKNETISDHEARILKILEVEKTQWVLLAGYMKILSPLFLKHFSNEKYNFFQVVNIHPSLLPAFKGADGVGMAYQAGVKLLGATLHLVDEKMDHGPILMQQSFQIQKNDSLIDIKEKNLKIEHGLYSDFLKTLATHGASGVADLIFLRS